MLHVKIYCQKTDDEQAHIYQVVSDVLNENSVSYTIARIWRPEELYRDRIFYPPRVVMDGETICAGCCPTRDDILAFLAQRGLLRRK